MGQANTKIKNGNYEDASNILEKIIGIDPGFGKAYNHMGYLYEVKFKEYEKGETLYKLCLEKSPLYPLFIITMQFYCPLWGNGVNSKNF